MLLDEEGKKHGWRKRKVKKIVYDIILMNLRVQQQECRARSDSNFG